MAAIAAAKRIGPATTLPAGGFSVCVSVQTPATRRWIVMRSTVGLAPGLAQPRKSQSPRSSTAVGTSLAQPTLAGPGSSSTVASCIIGTEPAASQAASTPQPGPVVPVWTQPLAGSQLSLVHRVRRRDPQIVAVEREDLAEALAVLAVGIDEDGLLAPGTSGIAGVDDDASGGRWGADQDPIAVDGDRSAERADAGRAGPDGVLLLPRPAHAPVDDDAAVGVADRKREAVGIDGQRRGRERREGRELGGVGLVGARGVDVIAGCVSVCCSVNTPATRR